MDKVVIYIKMAIALAGGWLATMLGGFDNLLILLLTLEVIDSLLGAGKSIKKKEFASSIFFWGTINKAITLAIIAIMVQVDAVIGKAGMLRNVFIIWFIICEAASILENCGALGVPMPDGLLSILVQVRKGFSINISKIVKKLIDEYSDESDGSKNEEK